MLEIGIFYLIGYRVLKIIFLLGDTAFVLVHLLNFKGNSKETGTNFPLIGMPIFTTL